MNKQALLSSVTYPTPIQFSDTDTRVLHFKTIQYRNFLSLRGMAGRIVNALVDFRDKSDALRSEKVDTQFDSMSGIRTRHTVERGSVPETALANTSKRKQSAMEALIDVFMSDDSSRVVCNLIADSLRDEGYTLEDVQKADLAIFLQLLTGFLDANVGVLIPLISRLGALTGEVQAPTTDEDEVPPEA